MSEKKYVYSRERKVLHSLACGHVSRMNENNKIYSGKDKLIMHYPLCMHCANQMFKASLSVGEKGKLAKLFANPKNTELWFELLINREAEITKQKGKLRILCGEDTWQIVPIENSEYVNLLHNNYIVAGDIRYFESGFHKQFKHAVMIQTALKCILEYNFRRYHLGINSKVSA